MWVLLLHDMREHLEAYRAVCKAETSEELNAFVERETVAPYRDGKWEKNFRKGGPLEWYSKPWEKLEIGFHLRQAPTLDEYLEIARMQYKSQVEDVPLIADIGKKPPPPVGISKFVFLASQD